MQYQQKSESTETAMLSRFAKLEVPVTLQSWLIFSLNWYELVVFWSVFLLGFTSNLVELVDLLFELVSKVVFGQFFF